MRQAYMTAHGTGDGSPEGPSACGAAVPPAAPAGPDGSCNAGLPAAQGVPSVPSAPATADHPPAPLPGSSPGAPQDDGGALSMHSLAASLQAAALQPAQQAAAQPALQQPEAAAVQAATQQQPLQQPAPADTAAVAGEAGGAPPQAGGQEAAAQQLQQLQQQQQQDLEQQGQQEAAPGADDHATVFFAKVPRSASRAQVEQLFAAYGEVVNLNLFVPYEGAPASKGCGLVVMRSPADAAAAIAGLENYTWEGMHSAMVLKLMGGPVQRRADEGRDGSGGGSPQLGGRGGARFAASRPSSSGMHGSLFSGFGGPGYNPVRLSQGMDVPPAGCGPDAYKLFVGNVPRALTESDLMPVFQSIGPVKELVVLRDRHTQESKGSAFVWYASGADADRACLDFNMRLVMQTHAGPASRPLVVRRAVTQKQGQQVLLRQQVPQPAPGPGAAPEHLFQGGLPASSLVLGQPDVGMVQVVQGGYAPMAAPGDGGMRVYDPRLGVPPVGQLAYAVPAQQQAQLWPQGGAAVTVPGAGGQLGYEQQPYAAAGPVMVAASTGLPQPYLVVQQGAQQQHEGGLAGYGQQLLVAQAVPSSASLVFAPDQAAQQPLGGGGGGAGMLAASPQAVVAGGGQQPLQVASSAAPVGSTGPQQYASYLVAGSSPACGSPSLGAQQLQVPGAAGYPQEQGGGGGGGPAGQVSVSIPLTAQQLSQIGAQLGSVSAMSGASLTTEQNYACGSYALVITAASQQQVALAWQLVQGMLAAPGSGGGAPQPEATA